MAALDSTDILPRKPDTNSEQSNCDESGSGSESDSDIGVDPAECKVAGRAIARCHDMFADVKNVIDVLLLVKQAEAAENGELSESEDEEARVHRDRCLSE